MTTQDQLKTLKAAAKTLGRELQGLGYPKIAQTHLLEALSRTVGFETWTSLRALATTEAPKPAKPSKNRTLPYPPHFVAATYAAGEFFVDVVKWEDPKVGLGYGFYAYDHDTGRCLTPTAPFLFDIDEVPTYEQIRELLDALYRLGECSVCGYVSEENEGIEPGSACRQSGCTGHVRPFLKELS